MTLVTSREAPNQNMNNLIKKILFFGVCEEKKYHHNFSLAWQSHIGLEPQKSSL